MRRAVALRQKLARAADAAAGPAGGGAAAAAGAAGFGAPRSAALAARLASGAAAGPSTAAAAAAAAAEATARLRAAWARRPPSWVERSLACGYSAPSAALNALLASQTRTHWARLGALLAAERATRRDPLAWCLRAPPSAAEEAALDAAEAAAAAAARAPRGARARLAAALSTAARLLFLLALFSPVALTAAYALGERAGAAARARWARALRRTLEAAGPAFIKWGQWAATRRDLFPPDLCAELERLHSQVGV
jgi:aarF domain-containing kinase